jgi:hypothetical protein
MQTEIYKFIHQELGQEVDLIKLDTNLANIINVLSKLDLTASDIPTVNSFEIERKIAHNQLLTSQPVINEYSAYYSKVDAKYTEFDRLGANKSMSVLAIINKSYREQLQANAFTTHDQLYLQIIDNVILKVKGSSNYINIPADELDLCVNILVVDAFIRCKVFENPVNYRYATA